MNISPVRSKVDVVAARDLIRTVAKAIRWRESIPDPAEEPCHVALVQYIGHEHFAILLVVDGPRHRFSLSSAAGAITVNGDYIKPRNPAYDLVRTAILKFAKTSKLISGVNSDRLLLKESVVRRLIGLWVVIDPSLSPKTVAELERTLRLHKDGKDLLLEAYIQNSPYLYMDGKRYDRLTNYLQSRPDYFIKVGQTKAGDTRWKPR